MNESTGKESLEPTCNTPKLATHLAPKKLFNINSPPHNQNFTKQHTKSESDTVVSNESDTLNDDLNEVKRKKSQDSNSKLTNQSLVNGSSVNSSQIVKNLTFSPTLQIKSNNQKSNLNSFNISKGKFYQWKNK